MSERQIVNRVKKLQELEVQRDELNKQIDALKEEIQGHMQEQEELKASNFIIRWPHIVTNRLDTARIKKELPDIYSKYIKATSSRRFSISTL